MLFDDTLNNNVAVPSTIARWNNYLLPYTGRYLCVEDCFNVFKITSETTFQYKILHRILIVKYNFKRLRMLKLIAVLSANTILIQYNMFFKVVNCKNISIMEQFEHVRGLFENYWDNLNISLSMLRILVKIGINIEKNPTNNWKKEILKEYLIFCLRR